VINIENPPAIAILEDDEGNKSYTVEFVDTFNEHVKKRCHENKIPLLE